MSEVRVTDTLTGGEKGSKPERYDLIPPHAMDEVARVYGYGATKYANRNWERGYDWGLSLAALHRHIKAFEKLESYDEESHCHHLAHAVFHCLLLMSFEANKLGTDSRSTLNRSVAFEAVFDAEPLGTPAPEWVKPASEDWKAYPNKAYRNVMYRDVINRALYLDGKDDKTEAEQKWLDDHAYVLQSGESTLSSVHDSPALNRALLERTGIARVKP